MNGIDLSKELDFLTKTVNEKKSSGTNQTNNMSFINNTLTNAEEYVLECFIMMSIHVPS